MKGFEKLANSGVTARITGMVSSGAIIYKRKRQIQMRECLSISDFSFTDGLIQAKIYLWKLDYLAQQLPPNQLMELVKANLFYYKVSKPVPTTGNLISNKFIPSYQA